MKRARGETSAGKAERRYGVKQMLLPPLMGLVAMCLVLGLFHGQLISGYLAYELSSREVLAQPVSQPTPVPVQQPPLDPNAPAKIKIGKISVDAPVVYGQTAIDERTFQLALRNGVVHYPGTATPGEPGNVVLFGHSSVVWWAPGDYKFVFALLEKLAPGDTIQLEYQGRTYRYEVAGSQIVPPSEVSVLHQGTKHELTLITCYPVGTDRDRLIVHAVQVSPDPKPAPSPKPGTAPAPQQTEVLPSATAPSLWDKLRALF